MMHSLIAALLTAASLFPLVALGADRSICGNVTDTPSSQVPANARCKFEGKLSKAKAYITTQSSFTQCRDQCLVDEKCLSFSFKPTDSPQDPESSQSGSCMLYHLHALKKNSRKGTAGAFLWDRACFTVETYYDLTPIKNGNFNSNLTDWRQDSPGVTIHQDTNGVTGKTAWIRAECRDNQCVGQSNTNRVSLFQQVFLCQGVRYSYSFDLVMPVGQTKYNGTDGDDYIGGASIILGAQELQTDIAQIKYDTANSLEFSQPPFSTSTVYKAGQRIRGSGSYYAFQSAVYVVVFYNIAPKEDSYVTLQVDNVLLKAN